MRLEHLLSGADVSLVVVFEREMRFFYSLSLLVLAMLCMGD